MTDIESTYPDLKRAVQSAVYNAFATDKFGDELVTVEYTHERVHNGDAFDATHEFNGGISGGADRTVLISVPSTINAAHVRVKEWTPSNESIRVELFRNPTIDTNGSALDAVHNVNDGEGSPEVSLEQGTTTTADGTLLKVHGTAGTKDSASVNYSAGEELILQPDTDYFVRVTNLSSNNAINYLWFNMFWYEV